LLTDDMLREAMAERGKAKVGAEFDARNSAAQIGRLFEGCARADVSVK
jgi:hypothetical protein